MSETIVATIEMAEQIGPDDWRMRRLSANFSVECRVSEILKWAAAMGMKSPTINDVKFSELKP